MRVDAEEFFSFIQQLFILCLMILVINIPIGAETDLKTREIFL